MPAISNLNKAHRQINQQMLDHQGPLTAEVAKGFLEKAITDFNLPDEKVSELKAMKFDRGMDKENPSDTPKEEAPTLESLEAEIKSLKACISEIATLSGYANYLSKHGLKRTEPAKRK